MSDDAGWRGNGDWKDILAIVCGHGGISGCMKIMLKLSEDYYQARMADQITFNSQRVIDFIRWRPPSVNLAKLNMDGTCKGGNIAGSGGIIRGSDGECIGGFAIFIADCSAFVAELWGVLEGLSYARRIEI